MIKVFTLLLPLLLLLLRWLVVAAVAAGVLLWKVLIFNLHEIKKHYECLFGRRSKSEGSGDRQTELNSGAWRMKTKRSHSNLAFRFASDRTASPQSN